MLPRVNDNDDISIDTKKEKEVKWYHQLLLNRPLKVILAFLLVGILAPILLYALVLYASVEAPPSDSFSQGSCLLPRAARLECGHGATHNCHSQCCYDANSNRCFHRFPSRFSYLSVLPWDEDVRFLPRVSFVPFRNQNSLPEIKLSRDEITPSHLSLTFYNSWTMTLEGRRLEHKYYTYNITTPELNVAINGIQGTIFNMLRGPLIASPNIWEIAFRLTEETMYGLGEIPLKEDTVKIIYSYNESLSSIPLIFAKSNGSYHGLLINVTTPTEVRIQGFNNIVVRSIALDGLQFHLFVGPQPKDIMRDVMKLIGINEKLEYWMLGAHVCSKKSGTPAEAFSELTDFLQQASNEKIPIESHCGIQPIVFHSSRCESDETEYIERGAQLLQDRKIRFVPHVSPYIHFEDIENQPRNSCSNIALEYGELMLRDNLTGNIYTSVVGEMDVLYPDYENVPTSFVEALWRYGPKPDGFVLENNWPLDEYNKTHEEIYRTLPYFNENFQKAMDYTPQWNISRPSGGRYMYTHNKYGNNVANAFRSTYEDIPIWTTSQWMNGDISINKQNVPTSWSSLQKELIEAALGGISGHWFWSSPICGDTDNYDPDTQMNLCVKWYMAATYMPMWKIHSGLVRRHPLSVTGTTRIHMTTALNNRLSLLPYFFTTLQTGPLLRPMFYQFPDSEKLLDLQSQFSVGDDILIVPNLQPSQSHVHIWMPPGTWYEFWSGLKLEAEEGEAVTMTTTEADFLSLIRGGSIIAMQRDVKETAVETREQSDFTLTIALECETTNTTDINLEIVHITECNASGWLYITDDLSINFKSDAKELIVTAQGTDFKPLCNDDEAIWAHYVKEINIYGLDEENRNYDHHRHVNAAIDLCQLGTLSEIVFDFISED